MRLQQDRTAFVTPEQYNEMKERQLDGRLELKEFTEINQKQDLEDENRTLNEANAALSYIFQKEVCLLYSKKWEIFVIS